MSKDPILAAIANHRRAHKALELNKLADNWTPEKDPTFELYNDLSDNLFRTVPSTPAGALALLNYIIGQHDDWEYWAFVGVEFPRPLLKSLRQTLKICAELVAQSAVPSL